MTELIIFLLLTLALFFGYLSGLATNPTWKIVLLTVAALVSLSDVIYIAAQLLA